VDVHQCAGLLARDSTRVLILHGSTGCGKSSFLRAGLIPFMESEEAGFKFPKESADSDSKTILIRSTDKPLLELARSVYEFANQKSYFTTPTGERRIRNLGQVLIRESGETETEIDQVKDEQKLSEPEFKERAAGDPDYLVHVLEQIAARLTKTLIFIIDQGEEVLTLRPDKEGDSFRESFFDFLARFSRKHFDLKLMVALRTEYYGRFLGKMQRRGLNPEMVKHYLLDELTPEQMIRAIERPTLKEEVGDYGAPYDFYHFEYDEELPKKIVDDLMSKRLAGGILPVMQIICDRLYRKSKTAFGTPWKISKSAYDILGSIEDQIDNHFKLTLDTLCRKYNITSDSKINKETERWKEILSELAKAQPDGTITTDVRSADQLKAAALKADCQLDFYNTMEYLTGDKVRILRQVDMINAKTNEIIKCYGLGHDAIGLILNQWKATQEELESTLESRRRFGRSFALAYIFIGGGLYFISKIKFIDRLSMSESFKRIAWALIILGAVAFSTSYVSKEKINNIFYSCLSLYVHSMQLLMPFLKLKCLRSFRLVKRLRSFILEDMKNDKQIRRIFLRNPKLFERFERDYLFIKMWDKKT